MRIRITARGIYGADGEIPIGSEFDIAGEPPAGWAGRYDVVTKSAPKDAELVVNPGSAGSAEPEVEAPRRGRPRKDAE